MPSHGPKYIVVLKSDCEPDDDVSFDNWSFEDACAIAAALNTGAVQETEKTTDEASNPRAEGGGASSRKKPFADIWFGKSADYPYVPGYGIRRVGLVE